MAMCWQNAWKRPETKTYIQKRGILRRVAKGLVKSHGWATGNVLPSSEINSSPEPADHTTGTLPYRYSISSLAPLSFPRPWRPLWKLSSSEEATEQHSKLHSQSLFLRDPPS